jgi:ribosomal protein L37AE/L43A
MKQFETIYKFNKTAKVGTTIVCPICGETFSKRQYAQAFCCSECKDKYWNKKGDRHSKGYYTNYNKEHPERLNRGYTKGYVNGNVNVGPNRKRKGGYVYDNLGRAYSLDPWNPTMTQMLNERLSMWHDDDWQESCWDD